MAPSSAEVIQDWGDYIAPPYLKNAGPYTFERSRLAEAIQVVSEMLEEDKKKAKAQADAIKAKGVKPAKKEDVDFLVLELLLPRSQAEKFLQESDGNLGEAIKKIMLS